MLNKFQKFLEDTAADAENLFKKVTDKKAFERIVGAIFLVSQGNGIFKPEEKMGLAALVAKEFPHFGIPDILKVIEKMEAKMAFDAVFGKAEIMELISKAQGDEKGLIIRSMAYIGASDGDFDNTEKAITKEVALVLQLNPADYGL